MSDARPTRSNPRRQDGSTRIASPLDPFLRDFLAAVDRLPNGLNPTRGLKLLAEECHWENAFVEVLFTAARTRGLVGPLYSPRARNKLTWVVSTRGRQWLGPSEAVSNERANDFTATAARDSTASGDVY